MVRAKVLANDRRNIIDNLLGVRKDKFEGTEAKEQLDGKVCPA